MSNKPAEILVYEFLDAAKSAAPDDSLLKTMELHDTIYQDIKTSQGVRIGEVPSEFSPTADGTFKEFNAEIPIACFARVKGTQKSNRTEAIQKVFDITLAVTQLFYGDASLGGRVCDSIVVRGARGFDELDGEPYAVSNFSLVVNPSGEYDLNHLGRLKQ